MNNYFLDLHKEWMETRELPYYGLCNCVKRHKGILNRFKPSQKQINLLMQEGKSISFWASGAGPLTQKSLRGYTPLRQTIVLFCHEILNTA
jgi:hypothetical protein